MSLINKLVAWFVGLFVRQPQRYYGWKRDTRDRSADPVWVPNEQLLANQPAQVDLRSQDGPIYNQGNIGSCTANAWLGVFMFVCKKLFGVQFDGSRLMLYYDTRELEGTTQEDSGCYIADGTKVLSKIGVCDERDYPYDTSKFKQKPPARCYDLAKAHKIVDYARVSQKLEHLKACVAEGYPFIFGFEVYESFQSAEVSRTGIMPMPKSGERMVGGHAVEAIGYVDGSGKVHGIGAVNKLRFAVSSFFGGISNVLRHLTGMRAFMVTPPANTFIVRNSWGTRWGDNGYFYMPFAFITSTKYCDDFWTIRKVTNG